MQDTLAHVHILQHIIAETAKLSLLYREDMLFLMNFNTNDKEDQNKTQGAIPRDRVSRSSSNAPNGGSAVHVRMCGSNHNSHYG